MNVFLTYRNPAFVCLTVCETMRIGWYHPSEVPARPRTSIYIWTLVQYCTKQIHGPELEVIGSLPTAMLDRHFRRESKDIPKGGLRSAMQSIAQFEITLRVQNVELIYVDLIFQKENVVRNARVQLPYTAHVLSPCILIT